MLAAGAQSTGARQIAKSSSKSNTAVHEITLPQYSPDDLPGPNQNIYQQRCLLCHSSRYVLMQPAFSRTVWEKEVKKMVDMYGAPISPDDQQQIVKLLSSDSGTC